MINANVAVPTVEPMLRMTVTAEVPGSMIDKSAGSYTDEEVIDIKATAFNQEGSKVVKTSMKIIVLLLSILKILR